MPVTMSAQEKRLIEECLPGHMMNLMGQGVVAAGFQLRPDILQKLNVASAAPLVALKDDLEAVKRCAKEVDSVSTKLLWDLAPQDPVHGLYACAVFCLLLVEERRLLDAQNMAVLVSMVLMDDLKQEGYSEHYHYKEKILTAEAHKLISKAVKAGYYGKVIEGFEPETTAVN